MPTRSLVIVDAPDRGHAFATRLLALGYEVAGVWAGEAEALADEKVASADLVLLGLRLQGDAGSLALVDALRQRGQSPGIVLVTDPEMDPPDLPGDADDLTLLSRSCADGELRAVLELALFRHHAMRAAEEVADRFFATSVDMLCMLGFDMHFRRLNPAWERTLGFTRAELMSRPFIEFVHPDDRERTLAQNAAVRGGGQALAFENRYLCKDGSYRWLRWNAAPDLPGQLIYSAARDVTESRRAEEERERLVRELQAALAEVRTLREILPICSYCRKIRDDENYWDTVESYIARHTATRFSHGICPECMASEVEPQFGGAEPDEARGGGNDEG